MAFSPPGQNNPSPFPGMRWSPTGEARVFTSAAEVPEGWTDYHPDSATEAAPAPADKTSALPLTREQIIAALKERGADAKPNASTKSLYDKLLLLVEATEA